MSRWDKPAPFLRLVGDALSVPLPEGWETHPAGSIGGARVEVAFDPLRHDVTIVWDGGLDPAVVRGIEAAGLRPLTSTDTGQIWSRDRLVSALRQRLGIPAISHGRRRSRLVA
jgi:hypothetical protein